MDGACSVCSIFVNGMNIFVVVLNDIIVKREISALKYSHIILNCLHWSNMREETVGWSRMWSKINMQKTTDTVFASHFFTIIDNVKIMQTCVGYRRFVSVWLFFGCCVFDFANFSYGKAAHCCVCVPSIPKPYCRSSIAYVRCYGQ